MTSDVDLVMAGLAQAEVTSGDCDNSGGPEITIDGEVIPEGDPRSGVWNVSQGGFVLGSDCERKLRKAAK